MSDISVCRVCLANNIRMQAIFNTQYQKMYETLTGLKLIAGDGRPNTVCYICTWQLQRFYKFYKMSQTADKMLVELYRNGAALNQWTVSMLTRVNVNNLSVTVIDQLNVPGCEVTSKHPEVAGPSNCEQVAVKVESIDYVGNEDIFADVPNFETGTEHLIEIYSYPVHEPGTVQNIKLEIPEMTNETSEHINSDESLNNTINSPLSYAVPKVILERIPMDILNQISHPEEKSASKVVEFDFHCEQCPFRSPSATMLLRHSLLHDPSRLYNCRVCSYRYKSKRSLQQHCEKFHVGRVTPGVTPRYVCCICGKKFQEISKYNSHCLRHNYEEYQCELCDRKFLYKTTYQVHLRTHTGEKPFNCTHCDRTFNCRSNRRKHMKSHIGAMPHECSRCGRYFLELAALRIHMRDTCDERLICKFCGKRYTREFSFQRHIRSHQNENIEYIENEIKVKREKRKKIIYDMEQKIDDKFTCEMCQLVFDEKTLLQQHVVEHIL